METVLPARRGVPRPPLSLLFALLPLLPLLLLLPLHLPVARLVDLPIIGTVTLLGPRVSRHCTAVTPVTAPGSTVMVTVLPVNEHRCWAFNGKDSKWPSWDR
jgi:hypothetical protein